MRVREKGKERGNLRMKLFSYLRRKGIYFILNITKKKRTKFCLSGHTAHYFPKVVRFLECLEILYDIAISCALSLDILKAVISQILMLMRFMKPALSFCKHLLGHD